MYAGRTAGSQGLRGSRSRLCAIGESNHCRRQERCRRNQRDKFPHHRFLPLLPVTLVRCRLLPSGVFSPAHMAAGFTGVSIWCPTAGPANYFSAQRKKARNRAFLLEPKPVELVGCRRRRACVIAQNYNRSGYKQNSPAGDHQACRAHPEQLRVMHASRTAGSQRLRGRRSRLRAVGESSHCGRQERRRRNHRYQFPHDHFLPLSRTTLVPCQALTCQSNAAEDSFLAHPATHFVPSDARLLRQRNNRGCNFIAPGPSAEPAPGRNLVLRELVPASADNRPPFPPASRDRSGPSGASVLRFRAPHRGCQCP